MDHHPCRGIIHVAMIKKGKEREFIQVSSLLALEH